MNIYKMNKGDERNGSSNLQSSSPLFVIIL